MYPVKRSYPVKVATPVAKSNLYPVKKTGNLNQHTQSPSKASATRVQSYSTSENQTSVAAINSTTKKASTDVYPSHSLPPDYHGQQETNIASERNIHDDQVDRVEKRLQESSTRSDPVVQSLRKPSTGDPCNLSFIPGLTIHLPQPYKIKPNDLMTLFESCSRSKKQLKVETTMLEGRDLLSSKVFIQDKYICTGSGWSSQKSRDDAATKALDILCKFQPCRLNTSHEMFISPRGDRIEGLTLGMMPAKPTKEDCLDVIMDSCINLPVTWWDDGGKVFGDGRTTVLLINGRPICWGKGEDLDDAMMETAMRAIQVLRHRHLPVEKRNKGKTKQISSAAQNRDLESPSKKQKMLDTSNMMSDDAVSSSIKDLKIYLPTKKVNNPLLCLLESFFRSKVIAKMECSQFKSSGQYEAKLYIGDKPSDSPLSWTGTGVEKKDARNDAAEKALKALKTLKYCVYKTSREAMFNTGELIEGFKIYFTPDEEETALRQLTRSCEKCKIPLSWWHDSGGNFYGHPWTTVLVINSKPICWGHGTTLDEAKISTAITALERLQEKHPIVRRDEEPEAIAKEPEASTKVPAITGQNTGDERYLKTPIPGLIIYDKVQTYNTSKARSVQRTENLHAKSTILQSVNRCNMKVSVQDVPPKDVVQKSLGCAANLMIGDVLVACGYGQTPLAAQWNAWKVSFDVLIQTQTVIYEPGVGKSSSEGVADETESKTAKNTAALPESDNAVKPTGKSGQSHIEEKLNASTAIVSSLIPAAEPKKNVTSVKPMKFTVHSEWINKKANASELKMNEESDELIGKYLQIFYINVS